MNYTDYLKNQIDKTIKYSEYVAYSNYIAENMDKNIVYNDYFGMLSYFGMLRDRRKKKIKNLFN
jgi:hypothetical protein